MTSEQLSFTTKQNLSTPSQAKLSDKIGSLDTASLSSNLTNVNRLLGFYQALAPLCIGGPSSTTLELELSHSTNKSSSKRLQDKLQRHSDINKESTKAYSSVYPYQKSKYGVDQHKLDSINRETEQALHDRKRLKAIDLGKVKQGSSTSVTNTSGSLTSTSRMFSLYNNLQNVAAAQAAHQAAQAVAANAGGVPPQPVPIPPPSNTVPRMTNAEGNGVENAQNRLFCHQLYERMRAVQQSMTMAMAVNMASSSSGFPSPVGNAPPISSQNHVGQFVSSNHPSRYPQGQHPSGSNSNGTSSIGSIRQHRKRRANSNAIEGGSSSSGSTPGSRSSANHLSGDMIRRLRQQQQKAQETKSKPNSSHSTNPLQCPSNTTNKSSIVHSTYKAPSPLYGHSFLNQEEDMRGITYSRPPPLIEIDSPLKGLSKLTSSNVVAPPNAIAPSSLKLDQDSQIGLDANSTRYGPLQKSREFRQESSPCTARHSSGFPNFQDAQAFRPKTDNFHSYGEPGQSVLEYTVINGETIPAFNIGGEFRLCLPRILRQILSQYHWEQICLACDEMHIHCAPCTSSQLDILKRSGIIPSSADQCGLITKSDVERLISYLNSFDCTSKGKNTSSHDISSNHSSPNPQKRKRLASSSTPSRHSLELAQENISATDGLQSSNVCENLQNDFPKSNEQKFCESSPREEDENLSSNACIESTPISPSHCKDEEKSFKKEKKMVESSNLLSSESIHDTRNCNDEIGDSQNEKDKNTCEVMVKNDDSLKTIDSAPKNDNTRKTISSEHNLANIENANKPTQKITREVKERVELLDVIDVQHECFGKAWGKLNPKLYDSPESKCIKCIECSRDFSPRNFILHLHPENRESQTCHWGFDASHWRSYLHIQHEVYIEKDLSRTTKVTSEENGRKFEPYELYLSRKRQKENQKKYQKKQSEKMVEDRMGDDHQGIDTSDDISGKSLLHLSDIKKSEPLMKESKVQTSENPDQRDVVPIEYTRENKDSESLDHDDNETECNNAASNCPRTTYFQKANIILRDVKNKFLPYETKFKKNESEAIEGSIDSSWNKQPFDKSVESEKSHLSDNRSNIKHYRKDEYHNDENAISKRRRRSESVDIEVQNQKKIPSSQNQQKVTDANVNNNSFCSNSSIISDENIASSSTLAFRPWGSQIDSRDDDKSSYNYPNDTPNSNTPAFRGNYRDIPPLQRTWNTSRDKLIQESALLSKELVDSIGDLSKIHHDFGQKERGGLTSGGSSPLHPHSFSIDDPNSYVNDVKMALNEERGLSPTNRDYITEVLERLADRVTSAELSRNVVVGELVTMRERFQVLEAELSKKCDELRHLFILQQRGRPIGSAGSSSNSPAGHSSGDSNVTSNVNWASFLEKNRNSSPTTETRGKGSNARNNIEVPTSTMNFKIDTQTVPQSSSDNGRYNSIHPKSDENANPKRAYDSPRNEIHSTKKMSFLENEFNAPSNSDRVTSRQQDAQRLILLETEAQKEERIRKMYSKRLDDNNGLQKPPFLGFDGVEGNDTQGYFTRVDIDLSPGSSSSNNSRSPNASLQGRAISPIKDINHQYTSSEQNQHHYTRETPSPKQGTVEDHKKIDIVEREQSANENQSKVDNTGFCCISNDQQSKSPLQGSNCMKTNYSNKSEFKSTKNSDDNFTSRKELKNTESTIFSNEKCSGASLNELNSLEDTAINDEKDLKAKNEVPTSSKTSDDKLRERMLSIESELRSLRNELEGRNKISRVTPNVPSPNRSEVLISKNKEKREITQNYPGKGKSENGEEKNKPQMESNKAITNVSRYSSEKGHLQRKMNEQSPQNNDCIEKAEEETAKCSYSGSRKEGPFESREIVKHMKSSDEIDEMEILRSKSPVNDRSKHENSESKESSHREDHISEK